MDLSNALLPRRGFLAAAGAGLVSLTGCGNETSTHDSSARWNLKSLADNPNAVPNARKLGSLQVQLELAEITEAEFKQQAADLIGIPAVERDETASYLFQSKFLRGFASRAKNALDFELCKSRLDAVRARPELGLTDSRYKDLVELAKRSSLDRPSAGIIIRYGQQSLLAEEALSEGLIEKKHRDYLDSVAFFQTDNGAEDLKNLLSVLRENKDSIPGPLLDQAIRSPNYDTSLSILESMLSTEISADNASELFSQARHYFPSNIRDKLATNDRVLKKRYGFLTTQLLPKVITKMLAAQTLDSKQSRILMEKLHGHEDNRYDAAYASFRVHNTLRNIAGLDIDESLLKSVARDISLYVNVNSDVYNDRLSDILPPRTSNHEEALRAIRFKI